jgi:hypothetical protein
VRRLTIGYRFDVVGTQASNLFGAERNVPDSEQVVDERLLAAD